MQILYLSVFALRLNLIFVLPILFPQRMSGAKFDGELSTSMAERDGRVAAKVTLAIQYHLHLQGLHRQLDGKGDGKSTILINLYPGNLKNYLKLYSVPTTSIAPLDHRKSYFAIPHRDLQRAIEDGEYSREPRGESATEFVLNPTPGRRGKAITDRVDKLMLITVDKEVFIPFAAIFNSTKTYTEDALKNFSSMELRQVLCNIIVPGDFVLSPGDLLKYSCDYKSKLESYANLQKEEGVKQTRATMADTAKALAILTGSLCGQAEAVVQRVLTSSGDVSEKKIGTILSTLSAEYLNALSHDELTWLRGALYTPYDISIPASLWILRKQIIWNMSIKVRDKTVSGVDLGFDLFNFTSTKDGDSQVDLFRLLLNLLPKGLIWEVPLSHLRTQFDAGMADKSNPLSDASLQELDDVTPPNVNTGKVTFHRLARLLDFCRTQDPSGSGATISAPTSEASPSISTYVSTGALTPTVPSLPAGKSSGGKKKGVTGGAPKKLGDSGSLYCHNCNIHTHNTSSTSCPVHFQYLFTQAEKLKKKFERKEFKGEKKCFKCSSTVPHDFRACTGTPPSGQPVCGACEGNHLRKDCLVYPLKGSSGPSGGVNAVYWEPTSYNSFLLDKKEEDPFVDPAYGVYLMNDSGSNGHLFPYRFKDLLVESHMIPVSTTANGVGETQVIAIAPFIGYARGRVPGTDAYEDVPWRMSMVSVLGPSATLPFCLYGFALIQGRTNIHQQSNVVPSSVVPQPHIRVETTTVTQYPALFDVHPQNSFKFFSVRRKEPKEFDDADRLFLEQATLQLAQHSASIKSNVLTGSGTNATSKSAATHLEIASWFSRPKVADV